MLGLGSVDMCISHDLVPKSTHQQERAHLVSQVLWLTFLSDVGKVCYESIDCRLHIIVCILLFIGSCKLRLFTRLLFVLGLFSDLIADGGNLLGELVLLLLLIAM